MASRWIVKRGEKERGPFTSPQLKSLADSGQLKKTDLVTKQGQNRYVAAEKVKGLFAAPTGQPAPKAAPAKSKVPAKSKADDEELDFGVVEILEDDDDPIVVLEESEDEFDVVDFDYEEDEDDFEEPKPARSRSAKRETPPPRGRSSAPSRRTSAPAKPAKPKKAVKKTDGEEEDEENSPWLNIVYGLACVFGGICFFIALGDEDPDTWQTRRGAALVAVVKLLYNIGGRWMVLGLAILLSSVFFWSAFNQFRKA